MIFPARNLHLFTGFSMAMLNNQMVLAVSESMCFAHFHNGKSRQLRAIHREYLKQIQDRAWRDGYDCVHPRIAIFVILYTCHHPQIDILVIIQNQFLLWGGYILLCILDRHTDRQTCLHT